MEYGMKPEPEPTHEFDPFLEIRNRRRREEQFRRIRNHTLGIIGGLVVGFGICYFGKQCGEG